MSDLEHGWVVRRRKHRDNPKTTSDPQVSPRAYSNKVIAEQFMKLYQDQYPRQRALVYVVEARNVY